MCISSFSLFLKLQVIYCRQSFTQNCNGARSHYSYWYWNQNCLFKKQSILLSFSYNNLRNWNIFTPKIIKDKLTGGYSTLVSLSHENGPAMNLVPFVYKVTWYTKVSVEQEEYTRQKRRIVSRSTFFSIFSLFLKCRSRSRYN